MKIALIHSHSSGRQVAADSLRKVITNEGHEVVRVVEHTEDAGALADPPAELVVAAGGDGTVADAVRAIAGRGVPLALLPLGTANNIAFSIGIDGPLEELARGWDGAARVPFDLGVLHAPGGPQRFVEAAGGGLVERCMTSFAKRPLRRDEPPHWRLVRSLRRYRQVLARLPPKRWSLRVDDRPLEGEFLLVEVLNIRAVGPNLELASGASPSDGALTVVTAGEDDRQALAAYIDDRLAGRDGALELRTDAAQRVELKSPCAMHVDDALARVAAGAGISIRVQPGAVDVLVPARSVGSTRGARP